MNKWKAPVMMITGGWKGKMFLILRRDDRTSVSGLHSEAWSRDNVTSQPIWSTNVTPKWKAVMRGSKQLTNTSVRSSFTSKLHVLFSVIKKKKLLLISGDTLFFKCEWNKKQRNTSRIKQCCRKTLKTMLHNVKWYQVTYSELPISMVVLFVEADMCCSWTLKTAPLHENSFMC